MRLLQVLPLTLQAVALSAAETVVHEAVYPGAVSAAGQIVPRYDKGYLAYLYRPNRLELFQPDGRRTPHNEIPCPGEGACFATAVAVDSRGNVAVGLTWIGSKGTSSGIRVLTLDGAELRFIDTGAYQAAGLCFDRNDNLWSLGWQRQVDGNEHPGDYPTVRRFSASGAQTGAYLPRRSLWPDHKGSPGDVGRNYWSMAAASDRIGALVGGHNGAPPEWLVWDLNGQLISRTALPGEDGFGRAWTADGRLYARFETPERKLQLRVLDPATGRWTAVADNLPGQELPGMLLGADGNDLVYKVGTGMVRLLQVRPGQGR